MLNAVFLINSMADLLVMKKMTVSQYPWSPELFFRRVGQSEILAPCISIDKTYYVHVKVDDVYVVAVTEDKDMSPFTMMESLQNFTRICNDLIGETNTKTVLDNIAVVYDLVVQIFGLGHPDCITQQAINECKQMGAVTKSEEKLFPFVPNNLFGVASSQEDRYIKSGSASKAPLTADMKHKQSREIFVDLIEYLVAIIDSNGTALHTDIKGNISSKSYLTNPVNLQITLPERIVEKGSEASLKDRDPESIIFTNKRFHSVKYSEKKSEQNTLPNVKHIANPGQSSIMDYHVESEGMKLPFTMYHNFTITPKGNLHEVKLTCKLFCNLPPGCSPINWSATLPLPSKYNSASGTSTLKSIQFSKSNDRRTLNLTSSLFPAQSHHSITVILMLDEILQYMPYEMPSINLQFEIPNLCISNMTIRGLKIQNAASSATGTINKWVRCVTHSKDFQFQLKSDWV